MAEHTLKRFDEELERLNATISEMGGLTESQLALALTALREHDTEAAERVIVEDPRIDALDQAAEAGFTLHSVSVDERDPKKRYEIFRQLVG